MEKQILLVNITWNPYCWRNLYTDPKAGHSFARNYPGLESLNFKFDKNNIDNDMYIYGYVQWTSPPVNFNNDGIIVFYTKNIKNGSGDIVGIYGKAKIINNKEPYPYKGFKDNEYYINIQAQKDFSMLFPIPLNAEKFKLNGKRLVPQVGFTYKSTELAKKIILDEIKELQKNGIMENEYIKLKGIYEYYFGDYDDLYVNMDEVEQSELASIYNNKTKAELFCEVLKDAKEDCKTIVVDRKEYKRNNSIIAKIKLLREFSCQICGKVIIKKNGDKYIEAAHIKAKSKGGKESLNNIILLCPNHHKEFDIGNSEIIFHNDSNLILKIDSKEYNINLGFMEKRNSI